MAVRSGMADLISRMRTLVNDSGTAATWTDQELQDILDAHKWRIMREQLASERTLTSGTTYEYKVYHSRYGNFEGGGTAYFKIEDSTGLSKGTAYAVDYIAGVVTMNDDQEGTALYLTGWYYDINAAAADTWRLWMGKTADRYDVQLDGHRMSRAQWFRHCQTMAQHYDAISEPVNVRMWRTSDFSINPTSSRSNRFKPVED